MCKRLVIPDQQEAEQEISVAHPWWSFSARFNVGPGQSVPVVRLHEGVSEGAMVRWGFVPAPSKGSTGAGHRVNGGAVHANSAYVHAAYADGARAHGNGNQGHGAQVNGARINGAPASGPLANGAATNGAAANGAVANGAHSSQGHSNTPPINGAPINGAPVNGVPAHAQRPGTTLLRIDEVLSSEDFRRAWLYSQRCIVPLAGFYVWQLTPERFRQPFYVRLVNRLVFGVAALWERTVFDDDDVVESCALLTVPANPLLAEIGGREAQMPAILGRDAYDTWLTGTVGRAKALLRPYPQERMLTHPVSPYVNYPEFEGPHLIQALR
jgi:putative SOS response-associated peptidase YedK